MGNAGERGGGLRLKEGPEAVLPSFRRQMGPPGMEANGRAAAEPLRAAGVQEGTAVPPVRLAGGGDPGITQQGGGRGNEGAKSLSVEAGRPELRVAVRVEQAREIGGGGRR